MEAGEIPSIGQTRGGRGRRAFLRRAGQGCYVKARKIEQNARATREGQSKGETGSPAAWHQRVATADARWNALREPRQEVANTRRGITANEEVADDGNRCRAGVNHGARVVDRDAADGHNR